LFFVLELIEAVIDAALREEFLMRALLTETAFVEDEDAVSVLNGAEAMCDDQGGASTEQAVEGIANQQLGFGVDAGGGFVEDEEVRIVREGAGEIDELALADGERGAALVDAGADAFGSDSMKSARRFRRLAFSTAERSMSGVPRRTLDSMVPVKRKGSWRTMPNWRRRSWRLILRMSMPSRRIWPRWTS